MSQLRDFDKMNTIYTITNKLKYIIGINLKPIFLG